MAEAMEHVGVQSVKAEELEHCSVGEEQVLKQSMAKLERYSSVAKEAVQVMLHSSCGADSERWVLVFLSQVVVEDELLVREVEEEGPVFVLQQMAEELRSEKMVGLLQSESLEAWEEVVARDSQDCWTQRGLC
jgi:hypothetical protein